MPPKSWPSCILSKFYIKPQPRRAPCKDLAVVSYRNSTSNHNGMEAGITRSQVVSYRNSTSNHNNKTLDSKPTRLYLIEILHQTTTVRSDYPNVSRLYLIEILHQTTTSDLEAAGYEVLYLIEILHQTTTVGLPEAFELYLIEILHQTTTIRRTQSEALPLYLIEILHQTTTARRLPLLGHGCILSKFYIKPQLATSPSK